MQEDIENQHFKFRKLLKKCEEYFKRFENIDMKLNFKTSRVSCESWKDFNLSKGKNFSQNTIPKEYCFITVKRILLSNFIIISIIQKFLQ